MPRRNYNPRRGRRRQPSYGASLAHLIRDLQAKTDRPTERTDR